MKRKAFSAVLAVLLAWTAFAAALEIRRTHWIVVNDPWEEPSRWRIHSRHVAELEEFLMLARPHLPEGGVIGVAADPETTRESFFLYLWMAYLLPGHEVRHAGVGDPRAAVERWIIYGAPLEDPRFEAVWENARGVVYQAATDLGPEG